MVQATDGNFYGANVDEGASSAGCPNGCGTIFQITPSGNFSVLYNFDSTTGSLPYSTLLQHTNGLIYGATQTGGTGNAGPYCGTGVVRRGVQPEYWGCAFCQGVVPTAKVGGQAQILGQGFTGAMGVSFNGTPAIFTAVSDTYITATVPAGATTGSVTVTTPTVTLTSNVPFRVLPNSQSATTTKVTTSGSPSVLNEPVTFTATITSSGRSVPDGEAVPFFDGTTQIGLGSTASGVAMFTTSTLSGKTHSIKATYAGDTAFKTSTGMVTQIVELAPTTTSLNSSANPSNFGQSVTLTAGVATSGTSTPTGTVTFKNGSTTLGTAKLDSTATATLVTTKLPLGSALAHRVIRRRHAKREEHLNCADANHQSSTDIIVIGVLTESFGQRQAGEIHSNPDEQRRIAEWADRHVHLQQHDTWHRKNQRKDGDIFNGGFADRVRPSISNLCGNDRLQFRV